jgi:ribose-phosphate pyrophosphokinase
VFIIQPTSAPTNENLMELLMMADALKRSSVSMITAVIPYYGYARQDRRSRSVRVPISSKLVAQLIKKCGVNNVVTIDLHSEQTQGFFDIPIDNIYAMPIMLSDIGQQHYENIIVVSPDVGGVVRARELAKRLNDADLAIIDKRRQKANVSEVMNIIGDVAGKTCVMIDDMVDTAGTLCHAAAALKERGAVKVVAYCTHPVLSGKALSNIEASVLDELVVTNTIPLSQKAASNKIIRQLSVAEMLAATIQRIQQGESVSSLYLN